MSTIDRLEGVWNIVPTPFLEDGELDEASLPTLTRFVAGCGVDGMTILGVLGEAAKLSDDERGRVIRGVLAAAGDLPVCVGVSHAATGRAVAFAREAEALGAHSVMLAPPALARPNDDAVLAHYLAVAGAVTLPVVVQDHPASSGVFMSVELLAAIAERAPTCRVVKLEDEPSPPKVGRLLAAATGPARPGRPRRDHAARGAASRRGRHDDRLRLSRSSSSTSSAVTGRATRPAPARSSTGSCRSSGSRTSRASTWPSASTSTSVAGRSRSRTAARSGTGAGPGHDRRPRRWSSRASGWR